MITLTTLLLHKIPKVPARKALLLMDLQRDSIPPESKSHVDEASVFERIRRLTTEFRPSGDLIWVRSRPEDPKQPAYHVEADCNVGNDIVLCRSRQAEDGALQLARWSQSLPNEHKLGITEPLHASATCSTKNGSSSPQHDLPPPIVKAKEDYSCTPDSCDSQSTSNPGQAGEFPVLVQQHDLQIVKPHLSAFTSTSLLLTLRSKFIIELYICGQMSDMSLYETIIDAVRYGIRIVLVQDCLGSRKSVCRGFSFQGFADMVDADVLTSEDITAALRNARGSSLQSD